MTITVAIVGRPNVGKSTLFNRLAGRRLALVDDTPGVTRDRRVHPGRLQDLAFLVVDTAGLEEAAASTLEGRMRAQTEAAIAEADLVLFMIDARAGLTSADRAFADVVRRSGKSVVLVANKAESRGAEAGLAEAWELGFGEPVAVSAEHGQGMADLRDAMASAAGGAEQFAEERHETRLQGEPPLAGEDIDEAEAQIPFVDDPSRPMTITVVGRPNAGKSTLINALLGDERLLTGPEAGITRDAITVDWSWRGRAMKLVDTAGLRRKSRVQEKLEKLSVADALRAIRFAEVAVIVIDATMPFEKQDLQIADLIIREGRAPVIAFSKWDLIEEPQRLLADLRERTGHLLPQARGVLSVPVSAETGRGLDKLMEAVVETYRIWNSRIPTGRLNRWLEQVITHHPPPAVAGRRLKVKYITQVKTRPPGFVLSCSRPEAMPAAYVRYLVNGLRETFGLTGVPIRILLRGSENPYARKARHQA
jgi:GTP-binding protein